MRFVYLLIVCSIYEVIVDIIELLIAWIVNYAQQWKQYSIQRKVKYHVKCVAYY